MNLSGLLIGTGNTQQMRDYYTKLFGKPNWERPVVRLRSSRVSPRSLVRYPT